MLLALLVMLLMWSFQLNFFQMDCYAPGGTLLYQQCEELSHEWYSQLQGCFSLVGDAENLALIRIKRHKPSVLPNLQVIKVFLKIGDIILGSDMPVQEGVIRKQADFR